MLVEQSPHTFSKGDAMSRFQSFMNRKVDFRILRRLAYPAMTWSFLSTLPQLVVHSPGLTEG